MRRNESLVSKAAKEYSGKECSQVNNAFKAGAEWQKEQLRKEIINGVVIATKKGPQYIQTIVGDWKDILPEKVKLLIIKDDE